MKPGDIVVCIDDSNRHGKAYLTIGKHYTLYSLIDGECDIIDDREHLIIFELDRFVSMVDYRSVVIDNVLE